MSDNNENKIVRPNGAPRPNEVKQKAVKEPDNNNHKDRVLKGVILAILIIAMVIAIGIVAKSSIKRTSKPSATVVAVSDDKATEATHVDREALSSEASDEYSEAADSTEEASYYEPATVVSIDDLGNGGAADDFNDPEADEQESLAAQEFVNGTDPYGEEITDSISDN